MNKYKTNKNNRKLLIIQFLLKRYNYLYKFYLIYKSKVTYKELIKVKKNFIKYNMFRQRITTTCTKSI